MSAHSTHDRRFFAGKRPRIMAHRGASGEAPENTLPAFDLAVEQEADILEMDVHLTADGVVVVAHDDTVDRMTNGSGAIAKKTLAELRAIDAGYRFTADGGKSFPWRGRDVVVPTLEEVLQRYPQMPMNIEIKAHDPQLVRNTVALLGQYGRLDDGSTVLAAFEHRLMALIRARVRAVSGGAAQQRPYEQHGHEQHRYEQRPEEQRPHDDQAVTSFSVWEIRRFLTHIWLRWPLRFQKYACAFQVPVRKSVLRIVTKRFIARAHALGVEVHPWTVDDEAEMHRLLDLGVDGLFTNFPSRARKVLQERGLR